MKTEYKIALGLSILMSVGSLLIIVKNLQGGFIAPAVAWGAIAWCYYKKNHQAVKYSLLVFGSIYAIGSIVIAWGFFNFTSTTEFDIKNFIVLTAAILISPAVITFQYFANEMQRREHEPDFATQQQRTRVSAYVFVACVLGLMLNAIPGNKESNKVDSSIENKTENIKMCKLYWDGWKLVAGVPGDGYVIYSIDRYGVAVIELGLPKSMSEEFKKMPEGEYKTVKVFFNQEIDSVMKICKDI